jgi:hypothetical protein
MQRRNATNDLQHYKTIQKGSNNTSSEQADPNLQKEYVG